MKLSLSAGAMAHTQSAAAPASVAEFEGPGDVLGWAGRLGRCRKGNLWRSVLVASALTREVAGEGPRVGGGRLG